MNETKLVFLFLTGLQMSSPSSSEWAASCLATGKIDQLTFVFACELSVSDHPCKTWGSVNMCFWEEKVNRSHPHWTQACAPSYLSIKTLPSWSRYKPMTSAEFDFDMGLNANQTLFVGKNTTYFSHKFTPDKWDHFGNNSKKNQHPAKCRPDWLKHTHIYMIYMQTYKTHSSKVEQKIKKGLRKFTPWKIQLLICGPVPKHITVEVKSGNKMEAIKLDFLYMLADDEHDSHLLWDSMIFSHKHSEHFDTGLVTDCMDWDMKWL